MIQRAGLPPAAPVTPGTTGGFYSGSVSLTLPYPPSVNTYWRRNGSRYFVAKAGKAFRAAVLDEVSSAMRNVILRGRLAVNVGLNPPDRRRRDIDNVCKALLDALGYAAVYEDDSQIDRLTIVRGEPYHRA